MLQHNSEMKESNGGGGDGLKTFPSLPILCEIFDNEVKQEEKNDWIEKMSEKINHLTLNYPRSSFYLQHLESLMVYISDLTQDGPQGRMMSLVTSAHFVDAILSLICSWKSIKDKFSTVSFHFHRCYHLAIFILLGLVNGSTLCLEFIQTVNDSDLFSKIATFPRLLNEEIQYSTQEMLLEIICRICLIYSREENSKGKEIIDNFSPPLQSLFNHLGPKSIISEMRQFLSKVNELNANITSTPIQAISYHSENSSQGISIENVHYLDIGLEYLSFYVDDVSIISIRYSFISRLELCSNLSFKLIFNNHIPELSKYHRRQSSSSNSSAASFPVIIVTVKNRKGFEDSKRILKDRISRFSSLFDVVEESLTESKPPPQPQPPQTPQQNQLKPTKLTQIPPVKMNKKKTMEVEDVSSRQSDSSLIPLILEQLHQIQVKKLKKKLLKEKIKFCISTTREIEEYISQQWSPFMIEKSETILSKGASLSGSLTNEMNQLFFEFEEQIKSIQQKIVVLLGNLRNLEKSIESSKKQLKSFLNGIKMTKTELETVSSQHFEAIVKEAQEKMIEGTEKQSSKNSKNLNSFFLQSLIK